MGVSPAGGCDVRGGINGGGDLSLLPLYHSLTFYCDQADYGPVSCSNAYARIKWGHAVLVAGHIGLGGDTEIGWGCGTNGVGGGDGRERDRYEFCGRMFQQT